jgi:hypothetical protein
VNAAQAANKENGLPTNFRSQLILAIGLFLPMLGSAVAAPMIPITQCGTITQPGNYHVMNDLQAGNANFVCLLVTSSDVAIYLDGNTIHGTGQGILVENAAHVSVMGSGAIEAYIVGVNVVNVTDFKMVNVTVTVSVEGSAAVMLIEGTTDVTLIDNTLATSPGNGQTGGFGIVLAANDGTIRANRISGFGGGITVFSTGSIIQANKLSGNRVDLLENSPCGANTWKSNKFTTSHGCVQ